MLGLLTIDGRLKCKKGICFTWNKRSEWVNYVIVLKIFINFYSINYALNADKFGFVVGGRGINYDIRQGK